MKIKLFQKFRSLILISVLLLTLGYHSFSQGLLRGKIIDAETGEELIGATMMIKGTTIGAATDLDGNYSINAIEPGIYTFLCQFISYDTQEFNNVEIKDGDVTIINVQLSTVSVGLEEVEIKAKMENRTEAALLTVQKKSANVIDGISAQQMSRSGDSEAAGALRRVTGVNVEGGKYVYVRGLSDRYSKTTMNGADIPGLDPNRNTVQMDIFPTNLIDNIVVYKTFSPDQPGDYTGGLINIVTKDFPEEFTLHFGIRLGYNTQASFNSDFISYKGSSTDFLGYDNGLRNIPVSTQSGIPVYPDQRAKLTEITSDFSKVMAPEVMPSAMNGSIQFSVGNQVEIGKKGNSIGYLFGLSYKYSEEFYKNGIKGLWKLSGAGEENLTKEHYYNDTQGSKEALWGAVGNFTYKFKNNNKISLNLIKNQSGVSSTRYMFGQKPSDNIDDLVIQTRKLQWMQRSLTSGQLRGEHYVESLSKLRIEWIGSVTASQQDEPDMRFFTNSYYPELEAPNNYQIEPSIYKVPARFYRDMIEMNYFGKADFTLELGQNAHAPKLKFGGLYSYKDRDFNETRVNYSFQFAPNVYNGNVSEFVADSMIGTNYSKFNAATGSNFGVYVQGVPADDIKNSYLADQTIGAGYLMVDALTFRKLRIIAGARYEFTEINSASKDTSLPQGYLKNNDILPALALTYMIKNDMNLRFNYSRTLARPTFRELAPYASEDFAGGEVWIGNADLQRTLIDNMDIRWEYYFKPGEIFSIGAFYKNFKDPIEVVDNPSAQNPELTWQNVDNAKLYGAELDFRKSLDFIPSLRHFKVGLNLTYIYSQVKIDSIEYADLIQYEPGASDTRPMFGQSPYIINAYLIYNNPDMGLDVNLTYNVSGPKIIVNVKGGTPDIYAQPYNLLNLTASKTIGERLLVEFRWKNILNGHYKETYTYNDTEYIYREFKRGMLLELGFKYRIN
ncbi:MAG: TonB-dependent receptor [Bacteroidetes bacterium]|nr:TonB-dependent receptor [Bacteroidota bacterium]